VVGVEIFRPLLSLSREDLMRIAEEGGLTPAADPSNEDEAYERVRWRKLMPTLAEMGLDAEVLGRFAQRMAEADVALAEIADAGFEEVVALDGFGAARMERRAFAALSPAVATRVLRRVLNIAGGRNKTRALGQIEKLRDDLVSDDHFTATTLFGSIIRFDRDDIVVMREPGRMAIPRHHLGPGAEVLWDDRFLIANRSDDTGLTIGFAAHLDRRKLSEFLGFRVTAPTEAIRTAPIVRDRDGNMLALGGWSFDERVGVQLLTD
jgi:tRNA(Ile)-lysidine synthase